MHIHVPECIYTLYYNIFIRITYLYTYACYIGYDFVFVSLNRFERKKCVHVVRATAYIYNCMCIGIGIYVWVYLPLFTSHLIYCIYIYCISNALSYIYCTNTILYISYTLLYTVYTMYRLSMHTPYSNKSEK